MISILAVALRFITARMLFDIAAIGSQGLQIASDFVRTQKKFLANQIFKFTSCSINDTIQTIPTANANRI